MGNLSLQIATLTKEGKITIPANIRKILHLKPGDKIEFEILDHKVILKKLNKIDFKYHHSLEGTLSEWNSSEDEAVFKDL